MYTIKTWIVSLLILIHLTCTSSVPLQNQTEQISISGTYQSELIEDFFIYVKFYKDGLVLLKVIGKEDAKNFKSLEYLNPTDPKLGFGCYEKKNGVVQFSTKDVVLEYKFQIVLNENEQMLVKHVGTVSKIPDTLTLTKIQTNDELGHPKDTLDLYEKKFEFLSGIFYLSVYACDSCHSLYTEERVVGPPLKNLFNKKRKLEDGREVIADREYLKRSVLKPHEDVVKGYINLMPNYADTFQNKEKELNFILDTMMKL